MKKLSTEELLALNPGLTPAKAAEAQQLRDTLIDRGLQPARYRLKTPLTGRRHTDHVAAARPNPRAHRVIGRF